MKFNKTYELLGFIQGDGVLTDLNNPSKRGIAINIGKDDGDIHTYFELSKLDNSGRVVYMKDKPYVLQMIRDLDFSIDTMQSRNMPSTFQNWSDIERISFLRGMYSANGSVLGKSGKGRITYKTINKELVTQLKSVLESFGLSVYITTNKSKTVKFTNGNYVCKESYDINIGRKDSRMWFMDNIGFIQRYKEEKARNFL